MEDLLWIEQAKYIDGYKIALTFNDGLQKTVDLQNHFDGKVFEPLKDIDNFKKFKVTEWTIEWENGADYAPEYLYKIGA
ncbi:molybdopterin-guanine dinucleotide biosynthesis protein MobA [Bacteroidia bacterium]|nr:molybdopterin-guanine dinucleotide biosynthesis protein MobA [Bacteroidia bacterium]